jgi:hypothetical protein
VAAWLFWTAFGACVAAPARGTPEARVIVDWDPTACGDPHRVVLELADPGAAPYSKSAPCAVGSLELSAVDYGSYRGQIYASALGQPPRSVGKVELDVDERIVRRSVGTPR